MTNRITYGILRDIRSDKGLKSLNTLKLLYSFILYPFILYPFILRVLKEPKWFLIPIRDNMMPEESLSPSGAETPLSPSGAEEAQSPQGAIAPLKRKRGRPRKADVVSNKRGHRGVRGRPKGDQAIMEEYKARMLASPKSRKVIEAVYEAALDHNHKHQAAAWKLIMDRMLPVSLFDNSGPGGARPSVTINITGLGADGATGSIRVEDPIEGDWEPLEHEDD